MAVSTNQSQQVYRQLRDRIATGELSPGDVMSEAALAKQFGLSRTPIGEALRQLASEGLVDQVPRYGTIVRDIPVRELADLFEIREALEGMAAAKAAAAITPKALAELRSLCAAIDREIERVRELGETTLDNPGLRRFLAADMAFHMLIIASAGNQRLHQMIDQTRSVSVMFAARRGVHVLSRVENANQAHRAILAALEARNAEEAQRLVVQHVRTSRDQSLSQPENPQSPATLHSLDLPDYIRRDLVVPVLSESAP